ncbi:MAG: hypothetical protein Q9M36_00735 [Sulfurovum sp.]|nr:hypothetical protein [Sulfurovum sp.]
MNITQRLLLLIAISVSIFLISSSSTFFYTNQNIQNFKTIQEKSLPMNYIHIQNLYLLEKIRDLLIDVTLTNESDILEDTLIVKEEILSNLTLLGKYGLDTTLLLHTFTQYFDFAYTFTSHLIEDNNNF